LGWRKLRITAGGIKTQPHAGGLALIVFWCSSAVLLSSAFLLSSSPVDINADRYLVGLVYAAAAVIPVVASGRIFTEAIAVCGTFIFALAGTISLSQGTSTENPNHFPSDAVANQIARIAIKEHVKIGYAGYWDAAPITWATHMRVQVNPVYACAGSAHLCPFGLHYISSWYTPRANVRSFLLTDPTLPFVPAPTADLGPPSASYHVGQITMYVYPYDLATRISP
jgi:hypothetical protein